MCDERRPEDRHCFADTHSRQNTKRVPGAGKHNCLFDKTTTMKFSAVVCSLALTVAAATEVSLRTSSDAGRNLMEKARQLNNNNNNNY